MTITPTLQQRLSLGTCALLAALCLLTFFYSLWQWIDDWQLAHTTLRPTMVSADQSSKLIANLPSAHIFGQSITNDGEVPITNLQLHITGIVKIEGEGAASKAYISMSGQPSKIYQVGDILSGGVKVYEITPDAVILENDGHLEKLLLPREPLEFKPRDTEEHY